MMMFKVYILYAPEHDKLFIGMTSSLIDRIEAHNSDNPEDWTSVYKPWTLVHLELYSNESEAARRENYFESTSGNDFIKENILTHFDF